MLNSEEKSKEYNDQIDELLGAYSITKFYSKLQWYFGESRCYSKDQRDDCRPDEAQAKEELHKTLNSLKSLTAKEEFLRRIK